MTDKNAITQMLGAWRAGDDHALGELMPLVHDSLRVLANKYMRSENEGHTLQATALVNEAFLKLCDSNVSWQNRSHFLAVAAKAMRHILVDHARAKQREKRGGNDLQVTLYEDFIADKSKEPDVLDIEIVLTKLERMDKRKARIIELNIFGGMTYDEIGEVIGISAATVDRELRFSRAWLQNELDNSSEIN